MKTIKLYHGSAKKIEIFDSQKPMFFSSDFEDTKLAMQAQSDDIDPHVYTIEIDPTEVVEVSDYIDFHGADIFNKIDCKIAKMNSDGIDNNWYVVKDITKFNIKQVTI